jgi:hypothetical protein
MKNFSAKVPLSSAAELIASCDKAAAEFWFLYTILSRTELTIVTRVHAVALL